MRTLTVCLISLALIGSAMAITASSQASTSTSFNSTPYKVLDGTGTTANASETPWVNYLQTSMVFGAGTDNTTIYAWGTKVLTASSTSTLTGVIKRTIVANTTLYGDTALGAVQTADALIAITSASPLRTPNTGLMYATGGGYLAIANTQITTAAVSNAGGIDTLSLYLVQSSASNKVIATSSASVAYASGSADGKSWTFAPNALWYEDGYFYVIYETQYTLTPMGTGTAATTVTTLSIQAVGASNTTVLYTAPVAFVTGLTTAVTTAGTMVTTVKAQGSNYTMSSYIFVLYKATSVMNTTLLRTTGAATYTGSALADVATTPTTVYTPAGIISSNYTFGYAVSNLTSSAYGTTFMLNGSATAMNSYLTFSSPSAAPALMGMRNGMGFAVVARYLTSSTSATYVMQSYLANGTVNVTQSTLLVIDPIPAVSVFTDANGAVWMGWSTYDTLGTSPAVGPVSAYVAKIIGQVAPSTTTTSGSTLATLAALLSFVIMSLFMF